MPWVLNTAQGPPRRYLKAPQSAQREPCIGHLTIGLVWARGGRIRGGDAVLHWSYPIGVLPYFSFQYTGYRSLFGM
jgi:hypothetical protein